MLTEKHEATNYHTFRHIERVRNLINATVANFLNRGQNHDQTKLESPEVELFSEYTAILSELTFGSPEYYANLEKLKPALDHHYANNSHHPQHWPEVESEEALKLERFMESSQESIPEDVKEILKDHVLALRSPIGNMSLFDIHEMTLDWKASSERHSDGKIKRSIEENAKRFGIGRQLRRILENTEVEIRGC